MSNRNQLLTDTRPHIDTHPGDLPEASNDDNAQVTYPTPPNQSPAYPTAPASPKKKMGVGKILLIVGLALGLLCCGGGVLVFALGANEVSKSGSSSGKHIALNEAGRDGKFEFTVTDVKYDVVKVGSTNFGKTAQGQFVLVTITVKNIGDKPQMFSGSSQKAFSATGAEYANDTGAEIYANDEAKTFLNEINPGNSVTGTVVFDIPKGERLKSLELHDSPFSSGITVDL